MVWSVTVRGEFLGSRVIRADGTPACPEPARTMRIVIDAVSGTFLYAQAPAG